MRSISILTEEHPLLDPRLPHAIVESVGELFKKANTASKPEYYLTTSSNPDLTSYIHYIPRAFIFGNYNEMGDLIPGSLRRSNRVAAFTPGTKEVYQLHASGSHYQTPPLILQCRMSVAASMLEGKWIPGDIEVIEQTGNILYSSACPDQTTLSIEEQNRIICSAGIDLDGYPISR